MKKSIQSLALAALALILAGCTPQEAVTTAAETLTEIVTNAVTTSAVTEEPEPVVITLTFTSSNLKDGTLDTGITPDTAFNGTLKLTASGITAEKSGSFKAGEEYILTVSGITDVDFDVTAEAVPEGGEIADNIGFSYKKSLPQLSKSNINVIVDAMTKEEKANLCICQTSSVVSGSAGDSYPVRRLGIPAMTVADGPSGVRIGYTTMGYPTGTTLAQTWDTALVKKVTTYMGSDCRDFGVDVLLGPGMNIQKNILGGRNFEYMSEDPFLTGMIATAYTQGIQSNGVGVSLKHYLANNQETARGLTSSEVTERALREIYMKAFGYVVRNADPYTIMSSYNRVNGIYSAANKDAINGVLRGEFGFGGVMFSDWGASGGRVGMISAGNDMFCGGDDNKLDANLIIEALGNGELTTEQVDACCENILSVIVRTNVFSGLEAVNKVSDRTEKTAAVRKSGADGIVLLKNDGTLPIKNCSVALFGNASMHTETCGYGSGNVNVRKKVSVYTGLSKTAGITIDEKIFKLYKNCPADPVTASITDNAENDRYEVVITKEQAEEAAKDADIAIMTVSRITSEGIDHAKYSGDFALNSRELDTLNKISEAFHAQGKKVVMLINTGNPIETASWRDSVDAILYVGYPGEQAGYSIADVLTGAVNPSGKLACTWPLKYGDTPASDYFPGSVDGALFYEDIYVGYRYYSTFDIPVAYSFGYGMSYTSYEYSDFKISKTEFDGTMTASVTVKNTGSVAGREAVQFYVCKPDGKNEQPKYALCGFAKTAALAPGASETVTVTITSAELETYITSSSQWVVEAGEYTLCAAASSDDIKASAKFNVKSEILVLDTVNVCVPTGDLKVITKETGKEGNELGENIALDKPSYCDVIEGPQYAAKYGNDGDGITRWSGIDNYPPVDPRHWWYVDLGESVSLDCIRILWESNSSGMFSVYLSDDAENWTLYTEEKYFSTNIVSLNGTSARYVKIDVASAGWLSIYECEVYAK